MCLFTDLDSLYCTVILIIWINRTGNTCCLPVCATPHTGVEPCVAWREAQNDCSGFPAHRNNKTSRVGEDWPQIHCAGMSARSPGWRGEAVFIEMRFYTIHRGWVR